jgi:hypothetical protein
MCDMRDGGLVMCDFWPIFVQKRAENLWIFLQAMKYFLPKPQKW